MDAEGLFEFFEKSLRGWLPSLVLVRFSPANSFVDISANGVDDFVIVAMAATGANIRCEISASFAEKLKGCRSLSSCTLRLELTRHGMDVRLAFFLYEVFGMAVVKGPLQEAHNSKDWCQIKMWEDWLSESDDRSEGQHSGPLVP